MAGTKSNFSIFLELEREYLEKNKKIPFVKIKKLKFTELFFHNGLADSNNEENLEKMISKCTKENNLIVELHDHDSGLVISFFIAGRIKCSVASFCKLLGICYAILIPKYGGTGENGCIYGFYIAKNKKSSAKDLLSELDIVEGLKEKVTEVLNGSTRQIKL